MPDNRNKGGTSPLLVVAAIGAGVVAAVGSYFYGRQQGVEEERQEAIRNQTHTVLPPRENLSQPGATGGGDDLKKKSKHEDEGKECVICFRDFESIKENNEEIHTTSCGHLFCKHCIDDALRKKPECPYCRTPVEPHETLRVFI